MRDMNLPEADQDFLRDLVKVSRQRARHVRWVDRDGTARITTLNEADATRLNALARRLGVGSDAGLVPDPEVIVEGFHEEFEELRAEARRRVNAA